MASIVRVSFDDGKAAHVFKRSWTKTKNLHLLKRMDQILTKV